MKLLTRGSGTTKPSQCEVGRGDQRLGLFAADSTPLGRDGHDPQHGGNWAVN